MANNEDRKVLIHIDNLKQYFPIKTSSKKGEKLFVRANDGISLDIYEGETVGLVGESGCGKSTFGRTLLQLYHQTAGSTMYYGRERDEIAPAYVNDILSNLDKKRAEVKELENKAKELQAEFDKLTTEEEKHAMLDSVREADRLAKEAFNDIVQLIGGFYVADSLQEVSDVLVKEHKASVEIVKLKASREKAKDADKAKIDAQIKEKEELLKKCKESVSELQKKYKSNKDFDKYEAYKDNGINLAKLTVDEMRFLRRDLQLIFQDPYSSLNPRMTVGQIIGEGLLAHNYYKKNNKEMQEYVTSVMEKCGLAPYFIHRYPHQFSGGQRQRIGIARSLALKPKFVVCDEAVSALDVSIQSQIINLLLDLKEEDNLTYLFISHDLSVIKYISDRVGVMYLGNLVELSTTEKLFAKPMHPYTEALLSAIPTTDLDDDKETIILEGDIPSPIRPPKGCKFHTRCRYCTDICKQVTPEFEEVEEGHFVACHHKLDGKNNK